VRRMVERIERLAEELVIKAKMGVLSL